jgi:hypothetical protein
MIAALGVSSPNAEFMGGRDKPGHDVKLFG